MVYNEYVNKERELQSGSMVNEMLGCIVLGSMALLVVGVDYGKLYY